MSKTDEDIISFELDKKENDLNYYNPLLDRYENEKTEININSTENQNSFLGWINEQQEKKIKVLDKQDEIFSVELDLNTNQNLDLENQYLNNETLCENKEEKNFMNKHLINSTTDLPTLLELNEEEEDQSSNLFLKYHSSQISKNLLTLKEMNNSKKKTSYELDTINLDFLAKYLLNEKELNSLQPDIAWSWDSLMAEMTENFEKK